MHAGVCAVATHSEVQNSRAARRYKVLPMTPGMVHPWHRLSADSAAALSLTISVPPNGKPCARPRGLCSPKAGAPKDAEHPLGLLSSHVGTQIDRCKQSSARAPYLKGVTKRITQDGLYTRGPCYIRSSILFLFSSPYSGRPCALWPVTKLWLVVSCGTRAYSNMHA